MISTQNDAAKWHLNASMLEVVSLMSARFSDADELEHFKHAQLGDGTHAHRGQIIG